MPTNQAVSREDLEQFLFAEFGVNSKYVADLLQAFLLDSASVDSEWRQFFQDLMTRESNLAGLAAAVDSAPTEGSEAPDTETSTVFPQVSPPVEPEKIPIRGAALRIVENMESSLEVPTATSQRQIPIKLLDENRRLINEYLEPSNRRVSYTHIILQALLKALQQFPQLNDALEDVEGAPTRLRRGEINLGIAVDVTRRDGTRSLLVPNIKGAQRLSFAELMEAYDALVRRARGGALDLSDFQGTTVSLTNPGTLGTTVSNPRLMSGQGLIVATGAIEFPPEYQAMSAEAISRLGISKVITLTSTYDHRIIQGAESGLFLAAMEALLRGEQDFYDEIFSGLGIPHRPYRWAVDENPAILGEERHRDEIRKQARVLELINSYRVRGHLIAHLDPLGSRRILYHPELDIATYGLTIWDLDREFLARGLGAREMAPLRDILRWLRRTYCGTVGVEYRHIQSPEEKEWIRSRVESEAPPASVEVQKQMLWKLISAEQFEKFLATKYPGQKRFSIEGAETIVTLLDQLIEGAAARGVGDITIGMSHRGRLNVIANVIGRFCERIFTDFEGSIHPNFPHDQHDVKYHRGASGIRETAGGGEISVTVLPNPSHLEFVDPVVEGLVRGKQDAHSSPAPGTADLKDPSRDGFLAVLVHGDAAFIGEGIAAETLNLSQLPGYSTNGTLHLIINNQLGFTTPPEEGRSSTYSTDVARMVQAPIFHVNGDDPDSAYRVLQIALDYRREFHKDVVIDVFGFRRFGHNEGDEPTYTQPVLYRFIQNHPGVRSVYSDKLVREGVVSDAEVTSLIEERVRRYENALLGAKAIVARQGTKVNLPSSPEVIEFPEPRETAVPETRLLEIARKVTTVPAKFRVNPKIVGLLARRAKMVEGERPVDWAMAETLAFGSLLLEGISIRLAGQDTVRGTFSQRHATLYDSQDDTPWTPLQEISSDQARFQVFDSPLSEAGALAFEYGYSLAVPQALPLWEAQFGDFINAAQVIVDQFIVAGEEKWNQLSRVVLLLPHGYEGQGPEHSSARMERFLQLCARSNIRVAYCTTSAQYFHLLRRQALAKPKPLVLFTPKSLLRFPDAGSSIAEFSGGKFQPVLSDPGVLNAATVRRILLCSGKVYYDLQAERKRLNDLATAILRLEQLYPFPERLLHEALSSFQAAKDYRWVQEEPENMGAWHFMDGYVRAVLPPDAHWRYVGRPESASSATGSHTIHQMEQRKIETEAFAPL
ncbi:MAG: multifunctional oxoglutarate decarboxylase/oxoglutarate dehydrogenase thiamine pyrophosphate-binding subunit/dihydrolipoyllysine-residue succinyltransferase subunit [Acidobacteriia bacterium]|nr:multifunctional oxoglutarate decarboxylase/oxoglutarate dehydrogenase thiamine pyrophosphate-binding subunit/dihydrolipoyllysine-residue succinyltransferase subunit [Terriglobia bacterium]